MNLFDHQIASLFNAKVVMNRTRFVYEVFLMNSGKYIRNPFFLHMNPPAKEMHNWEKPYRKNHNLSEVKLEKFLL